MRSAANAVAAPRNLNIFPIRSADLDNCSPSKTGLAIRRKGYRIYVYYGPGSHRHTTNFLFREPLSFSVLWDNATRFVFTLAAAIVGLVAYFLLPSRAQIEQKLTEAYDRRGKWALFASAFLTLGMAGILGWEFFRYNVQTGWVGVNMGLYAVMGVAILVGNIFTMRAVRHNAEQVEIHEVESIEHHEGDVSTPIIALADTSALQQQPAPPSVPPPPSE